MGDSTSTDSSEGRAGEGGSPFPIGPMKRAPEQLGDIRVRTRIRREGHGKKRFPMPIPNGWFVVAESRSLAPGEMRSLYAFGKDLVLFRTESGEPRLVDAYCPHLGAHLGAGGKVEGESIRCPFHGWRYDSASGKCNDIPYGENKRIPVAAKLQTYPMVERSQMIWAWHHLEDEAPNYEVPEFTEFSDPDWTQYDLFIFELQTAVQECLENELDYGHFNMVHGATLPRGDLVIDGIYRKNSSGVEQWGPGCMLVSGGPSLRMGQSILPLDEENVRWHWWISTKRSDGDVSLLEQAREQAPSNPAISAQFKAGVSQDFAIWENKLYREKPLLLDSEKDIAGLRQWMRQFYSMNTA